MNENDLYASGTDRNYPMMYAPTRINMTTFESRLEIIQRNWINEFTSYNYTQRNRKEIT